MINRWIASFVVATGVGTGIALAEADGPDYYRVVGVDPGDVLNIRLEPNASASKTGAIPPDTDGVRNLGCVGGLSFEQWQAATPAEREAAARDRWCRIEYGGVEGWVAARFLAEGSGGGPGQWAVTGVDPGDVLNMRAEPSGNAAIIGALAPNETGIENLDCTVPSSSSTEWCRIRIRDFEGWVAGRFLTRQ